MNKIYYKDGYKHQLVTNYTIQTEITPPTDEAIDTQFIQLDKKGVLTIRAGYAWDGASGPTWDNLKVKRASLVHDALYQLLRQAYLDREIWRRPIDKLFYDILREDGLWLVRARVWYRAVRIGAEHSSIYGRKVQEAP